MTSPFPERLAALLGDRLLPDWRQPFHAAPRHAFLPDQGFRIEDGSNIKKPIDRLSDEDAWLDAAYSADIILTAQDTDGSATSSCSMPWMVFGMLGHLDVHEGQRVLEIGTGTGWNSALLAARLGGNQVYTVEVDPDVADFARSNLAKVGQYPTVITGDGSAGYPEGSPYDRVIATCTVTRIPRAWVAQTRPGGVILTPWGTSLDNGALLRLVVDDDCAASGKFIEPSVFMWMRKQAPTAPDEPDDFHELAAASTATVDISDVLHNDALFAAGMLMPGCVIAYDRNADGWIETVWLLSDGSWASVRRGVVRQLGERRLWDEIVSAHHWWRDAGKPELTRFGVTVDRHGQHVWLDDPSNRIGRTQ